MSEVIPTRSVRRTEARALKTVQADICILGAGISGIAAALEAAKIGQKVVLIDAAPAIGGQAVGSIIGTLIGLYTHGKDAKQIIHKIADELIADLDAEGSLRKYSGFTVVYQYDEVRLARWMERKISEYGVQALVGATMTNVTFRNRRIERVEVVTRYGPVAVEANGFIDASGDAALSWEAGLEVREPTAPVYGTLNFLIEGYDTERVGDLDMKKVHQRLAETGEKYGLIRHDGHLMDFKGKFMLANINHMKTPLDPLKMAETVSEGRRQADGVVQFLRNEFPDIFANARVRVYGNPGIRQTRWISSRHQLTLDEIRKGDRPDDAVTRCAWSVELHEKVVVHWEHFPDGHVYYIPLRCMTPQEADNVVAAGRCVDADTHALSAVRVMGPCIGMGAGAAHALALAGSGSVHQIDGAELQKRLYDNLDRWD